MPKMRETDVGLSVACETCGVLGPSGLTINDAMRVACTKAKWGYKWIHGATHYAAFFCPSCKINEVLDCDAGAQK